ncbi:MAG: LLM class flavin-dependent oxidoreductase [Chromatiales bacterium]|nr:LLM class flavin-dependent oxidoreductase [Chromatiales bacterium]
MEFGISCSKIDEVGLVAHAENLGYNFCWTTDSPMLRSNPWAILALAAQATQSIRLGVGVAVPGLRIAPDTANGIATINRLAPGRTFLGVGTGNTAMRTLGRKPVRIKAFAEYLRVLRALLDGEEVTYACEDGAHPIRFQNLEYRNVDIDNHIPIHVGGFGPRSQGLAGEIGDGLITGIPRGGLIPDALTNVQRGAERIGRSLPGDFHTCALVNVMLLEPGETFNSKRVIAECGPAIMANVHYLVDLVRDTGKEPPSYVQSIWEDYQVFHQARDAARAHQQLHGSHYSHLDEDEARFVTPEVIKGFCLAGQPDDVIGQLHELESQGLNAMAFIPPHSRRYVQYEDFARRVIANM